MEPGPRNLVTDVAGFHVGNAADTSLKSGTTVLTAEDPFTAAVHVMGGAPGTRETDLLAPDRLVQRVDALVLSGGSAFGLDAGSGVADAMAEAGRGFPVGACRIPIIPAAILFDLLNGGDKDWKENPYGRLGRQALENAGKDFEIGTAGAGTGATTANLKGGLGSASLVLGNGVTVGALVAANPWGPLRFPEPGSSGRPRSKSVMNSGRPDFPTRRRISRQPSLESTMPWLRVRTPQLPWSQPTRAFPKARRSAWQLRRTMGWRGPLFLRTRRSTATSCLPRRAEQGGLWPRTATCSPFAMQHRSASPGRSPGAFVTQRRNRETCFPAGRSPDPDASRLSLRVHCLPLTGCLAPPAIPSRRRHDGVFGKLCPARGIGDWHIPRCEVAAGNGEVTRNRFRLRGSWTWVVPRKTSLVFPLPCSA